MQDSLCIQGVTNARKDPGEELGRWRRWKKGLLQEETPEYEVSEMEGGILC